MDEVTWVETFAKLNLTQPKLQKIITTQPNIICKSHWTRKEKQKNCGPKVISYQALVYLVEGDRNVVQDKIHIAFYT